MRSTDHLSGLIRDRRIPIELCPASNQYTNGFYYSNNRSYVFGEYVAQRMTLTINTDDPWISHRAPRVVRNGDVAYPLSEEYLLLPLMYSGDPMKPPIAQVTRDSVDGRSSGVEDSPAREARTPRRQATGSLTRLKLLQLVFNGFDNAFLPAPERDLLIALVDLETFAVLARNDLTFSPAQ